VPRAPESRAFDLLGLGQISLDRLGVVDRLPAPGAKTALREEHLLPGGQIATALLAATGLGARCAIAGAVGDDEAGRLAVAPLERAGVDTSRVHRLAGVPTRQAWVIVEAGSGERTILELRATALALPAGAVSARDVASARVLLLDLEHPAAARQAAAHAQAAGVPVVLDADRATEAAIALAREVDFPIVSRSFAEEISSDASLEDALRRLVGPRTRMAVVTRGEQGSLAWLAGRWIATPAPRVQVRDTTGAGDVFRGAFAWAIVRGCGAEQALAEATAHAAASCRGLGAQGALPGAAPHGAS
jgi:sulfofructose kinase